MEGSKVLYEGNDPRIGHLFHDRKFKRGPNHNLCGKELYWTAFCHQRLELLDF